MTNFLHNIEKYYRLLTLRAAYATQGEWKKEATGQRHNDPLACGYYVVHYCVNHFKYLITDSPILAIKKP